MTNTATFWTLMACINTFTITANGMALAVGTGTGLSVFLLIAGILLLTVCFLRISNMDDDRAGLDK